MKSIPVDISRLTGAICVSAPEVKADLETGQIRTDRASGLPVYLVGISVKLAGTRKAYVLDVAVPGEPVGITEGAPVRLFDLEAVPWAMDGRSGISYKATAITAATPTGAAGRADPTARRGRDPGRRRAGGGGGGGACRGDGGPRGAGLHPRPRRGRRDPPHVLPRDQPPGHRAARPRGATADRHGRGHGGDRGLMRHGHAVWVAWLGLALAVSGCFGALALRRRSPRWYWVLIGYPACWMRMVRTWRALCVESGLTTSRRSGRALLGDLVVKGEQLRPRVPRLWIGAPRFGGVTARVRLLAGPTPRPLIPAARAMAPAP